MLKKAETMLRPGMDPRVTSLDKNSCSQDGASLEHQDCQIANTTMGSSTEVTMWSIRLVATTCYNTPLTIQISVGSKMNPWVGGVTLVVVHSLKEKTENFGISVQSHIAIQPVTILAGKMAIYTLVVGILIGSRQTLPL